MDLVTCTGCKHVFSPSTGQRVRCPACMKFQDTGSVKAAPRRAARRKSAPIEKSSNLTGILVALGIVLVIAVVLVIGIRIRPAQPPDQMQVASVPGPTRPAPKAAAPEKKGDPALASKPPVVPLPQRPLEDLIKPKVEPKTRPIDVAALPEVDVPEIKVNEIEVKKIAGVDQDKLMNAIRRGVAYLNRTAPDWLGRQGGWELGTPSLCGLALLECEMPPNSPLIQTIAAQVRLRSGKLDTYEVSLAILFLDRLGNPRDRGLIQTLAARLISGQDAAGGWAYRAPYQMTQPETVEVLSILQYTRPIAARPLVPLTIGDDRMPDKATRNNDPFADPFASTVGELAPPVEAGREPKKIPAAAPKGADDEGRLPPKYLPRSRTSGQPVARVATPTPLPATGQTQRALDIVTMRQRDRSRATLELDFKTSQADLSNSQFAVLALWAARRHGVVSDRALLLFEKRLRQTQATSGSWHYQEHRQTQENAALCCCGLLGIALGTAADQPHGASLARSLSTDDSIARALDYLGQQTKDPLPTVAEVGNILDLYALWSTERVAMIYHLKTIRGKDWYGWGAQNLVKNQDKAGSWVDPNGHSHDAAVDTSLALLFLVRSNLVQEISSQLRLQMPIQEK